MKNIYSTSTSLNLLLYGSVTTFIFFCKYPVNSTVVTNNIKYNSTVTDERSYKCLF